ncbi:MAG: alpha/beta fold hydrolase [Deltaproteobacteria bacterium]|nr:alpha/beta fold hydrolase [Deltaproteobacteria bacterium]
MPLAPVGSHSLSYEVHGDASGLPLLLIAGLGGASQGWLALQVPEFALRHRCVVFDHRGVGESQDPGGAFTTADLADDAAALLDALGIGRAHVLGAFMGGMVAQELALRHPERVARLVLVGTWARPDAKRRMLIAKWKAMAGHGLPREVIAWERMLWTLSDETLEQRDLVQPMLQGYLHGGFPMPEATFVRQCDACLGHDTSARLGALAQPALVLCGQEDVLTPPKLARELAAALPDAHLVVIPHAGHLVMAEAAKRFDEIVLQFLEDERPEA